MSLLLISFISTVIFCLMIIRFNHLHASYSADSDLSGVQKFHFKSTPRIGGIAIILGLLISLLFGVFLQIKFIHPSLGLLLCSLPLFIVGFIEDLTKNVGVKLRLLAAIFSALLSGFFMDAWLTSLPIYGADKALLYYPFLSVILTCFAVSGVSNSFNIIDGYHGLSSMVAIFILIAIAYVSFLLNDYSLTLSALILIGSLLAFILFNYPRGLIFLGDGGAYLIGFWIAELSIILTSRHEAVSKWFPLLLCIYPVFETIFTIYRRIFLHKTHPGLPDAGHLHHLIYKRVTRIASSRYSRYEPNLLNTYRNSATSQYLWLLCLFSVIPAILFWQHQMILQIFIFIFVLIYLWIYWSIIHFKIQKYFSIFNKR